MADSRVVVNMHLRVAYGHPGQEGVAPLAVDGDGDIVARRAARQRDRRMVETRTGRLSDPRLRQTRAAGRRFRHL